MNDFKMESYTMDSHNNNETLRERILPVCVFIGVEIVLGILGNSFVLYVFGVHYTRSTYRCFVVYLGLIDMLSCFTTMPAEIVSEMYWFRYPDVLGNLCKAKSFFNIFTVSADVLCLFAISIDRYKRTCATTAAQISPTLAKYLCIGITLWAGVIAAPAAIVSGVSQFTDTSNGSNNSLCGVTDGYKVFDETYYVNILTAVIGLSLVPMLIIYGLIAVTVCRRDSVENTEYETYEELETNDDEINTDRQKTVLLFVISLIFAITIAIYVSLDQFMATKIESLSTNKTVMFLIFFRLYFINHVLNPVIYGWLDPRFRRIFLSIFGCS